MGLFRPARAAARPTSSARLSVEQLETRDTPAVAAGFSESVFASGLAQPTAMTVAPDGRVFVAEKGGTLRVVQNGSVQATPFLTVGVDTVSERGLIGVALDPNFAATGFVYVYYTTNAATPVNRVSRFTASAGNPNVAQAGSELVLLDGIASTNGNHNGGALVFGSDGKLFIGVGEAGVPANAQTLTNLSGKVLRINADGSVPADNPFVGMGGGVRPEIWAYGLRNPFTMAVQPGTGQLFINDVGQGAFEEVDLGVRGANYGWSQTEGFSPAGVAGVTYPVYAYPHGTAPLQGDSIAGGVFYNPAAGSFPAQFAGDYFFGDFVRSRIFVRDAATGAVTTFADPTAGGGVVDLDVLPDGRLLYLSINTGSIYQIVSTGAAAVAARPVVPLIAAGTGAGTPGRATVLYANGSAGFTVPAFPGYTGGVRVATGDVTGDGVEDLVAVPGPGAPPLVSVYDGASGRLAATFYAFDPRFTGGLNVAVADVTGDGRADIIVGTATGASVVEVIDPAAGAVVRFVEVFPGFAGGVTVAAGDLDGDGRAEVIVGTATATSFVTVFGGLSGAPVLSFLAFIPSYTGGVNVGFAGGDIVTGVASGPPVVRTFDARGQQRALFLAGPLDFTGGVRVAGEGEFILVGIGPTLAGYTRSGTLVGSLFAFDPTTPGVFVG